MATATLKEDAIFKISFGMLITMGTGLVLFTSWLIGLSFTAKASQAQFDELKRAQDQMTISVQNDRKEYYQTLSEINNRLGRIEGALRPRGR